MASMVKTDGFGLRLKEITGKSPIQGVSLSDYSSFVIGGPADYFVETAAPGEMKAAVEFARREGVPFYVIGGGTNILFPDEGYRGLIIRNAAQGIMPGPNPGLLYVLSGTSLKRLVQEATDGGLGGLEFLAGIPGTVGGALFGNAGAFGRSIGDVVHEAVIFDGKGNERRLSRQELDFDYRHSALQHKHDVVVAAVLEAAPGDPQKIKAKILSYLDQRAKKQPAWGTPCAGSYFKNPVLPDGTKIPAAKLLEEAGAKKLRVGDAAVFSGHSNFIINLGRARARDVRELAATLKDKVQTMFGIALEEEVVILPEAFSMP